LKARVQKSHLEYFWNTVDDSLTSDSHDVSTACSEICPTSKLLQDGLWWALFVYTGRLVLAWFVSRYAAAFSAVTIHPHFIRLVITSKAGACV